jgi:hypothetical protein
MDYGYGSGLPLFSVLLVVYLAIIGFFLLVGVAFYVLTGFAFMKLFRKVGIEPWAAWVPYFNVWRILELGGQAGWFSLLGLIPYGGIVTLVFECIAVNRVGIAFRRTGSWVVLFIFLPFVWAWLLAADSEVYEPDLVRQRGYGPPLVGYGSAAGPYRPSGGQTPPPPPPAPNPAS